MKNLNLLLALHERTKTVHQKSGRSALSRRLFLMPYEVIRIGKHYDDINRTDISTESILYAYLARKVFINEKYLRNEYLIEEYYNKEVEFTIGLWRIICANTFGHYIPELPVPTTYDDLEKIFMNKHIHLSFNLYKTIKECVVHSQIVESSYCNSIKDFDLHCSLPGDEGWTTYQHGASKADGRRDAPLRLMQAAIGMFKYDAMNAPEPYMNFWKERASHAIKKVVALLETTYIRRFRNATLASTPSISPNTIPLKKFKWNIKRT